MIRLFNVPFPVSVIGIFLSEIFLSFACYLGAFMILSDADVETFYLYEGGLERTIVVVASIIFGIYFSDLYAELRVISRLRLFQQFCMAIGIAFLFQAFLGYISTYLIIGRWHMFLGSGLALLIMPGWRVAYDRLVIRFLHRQAILFLGDSEQVLKVCKKFVELPQLSMKSVGYLRPEPNPETTSDLGPWLGEVREVKDIYRKLKPDLVVVGLQERRGQVPVNDLLELRLSGVMIEDVSTLYERVLWRVPVSSLRPSQLLYSSDLGPNPANVTLQEIYSFVIAFIGAVITLPIMLMVALLVRLTSKGDVIYRQKRVGKDGKVFEVLKFRSMSADAEAGRGAVWAQADDPRVTAVGKWLRKLRLDELPQFFNVLKGDMALVGPRPERPEFVQVLTERIPFYGQRHAIKPGITGWAQISHSYGDSVEDTIVKLEYDLYYLKNLSWSFDFYIMFHTLKVMVLGRGAQ